MLHLYQLNSGQILLTGMTLEGDVPMVMFDNTVMFSMFIKDCMDFEKRCTGEDISIAFREAFK